MCAWRVLAGAGADARRLAQQFVVALSANAEESDVQIYLRAGMNKFYPKPVKIKVCSAAPSPRWDVDDVPVQR